MAGRVICTSVEKRLRTLIVSSGLARFSLGPSNSRGLVSSSWAGNAAATTTSSLQGVYHEDMYDHLLQVYKEDNSVSVARFTEVRAWYS